MQYPQIQFYRGSLVRLASGRLKQVEDLSSDDFIESARLVNGVNDTHQANDLSQNRSCNNIRASGNIHRIINRFVDENNNLQVKQHFSASNDSSERGFSLLSSPGDHNGDQLTMMDVESNEIFSDRIQTTTLKREEGEEEEDLDEDIDVEGHEMSDTNGDSNNDGDKSDDEELDVVSGGDSDDQPNSLNLSRNFDSRQLQHMNSQASAANTQIVFDDNEEYQLYIDSSVVRDFLEVGSPSSTSPASMTSSLLDGGLSQPPHSFAMSGIIRISQGSTSSCPQTPSPNSLNPNQYAGSQTSQPQTVLIKFFLESSRTIVFIEVPIEHPFFVFHRGWSSWNPQRTYDKFGLKCRKLKIGDTCISLIKRRKPSKAQKIINLKMARANESLGNRRTEESDQCNILFSSIKINE